MLFKALRDPWVLQATKSIPCNCWRVTYSGRQLKDERTLQECGVEGECTLHFVGRLVGGKGGFGSLLRGAGRAILTDNVDACRDLSGRRLRQANAEKRLAEWAAEARERELEKLALKHVKEQQKATQKEERAQVMRISCFDASLDTACQTHKWPILTRNLAIVSLHVLSCSQAVMLTLQH